MALYKIQDRQLESIKRTTFAEESLKERSDLQAMLKQKIGIISPHTLIVAEEFCDWEDSRRRIDLLGIDKNANLVVIEIKRTEDGGHMELQSIRYAAMISTLTFDKLVSIYETYLVNNGIEIDAASSILEFLEWSDANEENFAQEIKIVLVSAEFSKELTTSVMWLNDLGLDIHCVRMQPYTNNGDIFLDVQTVIPIPEVADYQVRIREKKQKERESRFHSKDMTRINIFYGNKLEYSEIKKADIGLMAILTLQKNDALNAEAFEFLKEDKTCSFNLIKTREEVTLNEEKYKKFRIAYEPDFQYEGMGYYVARNWGRGGSEKFKEKLERQFPLLKFEFLDQ